MILQTRNRLIHLAVHAGAIFPLGWIAFDIITNRIGPDPIRESMLRTGKSALIMLILCLSCTPLNTIFRKPLLLKFRRPFGLYSFVYASIHLSIFIILDYGLNFNLLQEALIEKRFAIAGLSSFLVMLPLAMTSTKKWQKRLGKRWKKLHRSVYLAGILAGIHFIWLVKPGVIEPWIYAAIILILLSFRLPLMKLIFTRKSVGKKDTRTAPIS